VCPFPDGNAPILNYRKMASIAELAVSLIEALDDEELPRGKHERICDTLDLEINAQFVRPAARGARPLLQTWFFNSA
jgi:hypothetical protein